MAIISNENILKVLMSYNPWWKTGTIMAKEYKRQAYFEVLEKISDTQLRRSVVLTGARRVGKTTIQYQIIEKLLKEGMEPKKIVFISLDHPVLKLSSLQEVLECYHENICPSEDVYYFFDEIQYTSDWDKWLKVIYDMQPLTNIVATCSSSPILHKGNIESGAGRWSLIEIPTLTFFEYLELLNVEIPTIPEDLKIENIINVERQELSNIIMSLSNIQRHFNRYLQIGGFPELALAQNDILAAKILREDVIDKVIKKDLVGLYDIRNISELERIFIYLCNNSSEIISIQAITKELEGVSRITVENYIKYLESANLIYQSFPINIDGKNILKASPKIYITDAAIRNCVLMDEDILSNPTQMGKIVETAVYKHVLDYYKQAIRVRVYENRKE